MLSAPDVMAGKMYCSGLRLLNNRGRKSLMYEAMAWLLGSLHVAVMMLPALMLTVMAGALAGMNTGRLNSLRGSVFEEMCIYAASGVLMSMMWLKVLVAVSIVTVSKLLPCVPTIICTCWLLPLILPLTVTGLAHDVTAQRAIIKDNKCFIVK